MGCGVNDAKYFKNKKNYIIIQPLSDTETIQEAIKRAHITTPANIILDCHGIEAGFFTWSKKGEYGFYPHFMRDIPQQNIPTIIIENCFGGSAYDYLYSVPRGTVLQTLSSKTHSVLGKQAMGFANEIQNITQPIEFYLEALDNFDPEFYQRIQIKNGAANDSKMSNPLLALPTLIGIGGEPPITIKLDATLQLLCQHPKDSNFSVTAWARALDRVRQRFDCQSFDSAHQPSLQEKELVLDEHIIQIWSDILNGKSFIGNPNLSGKELIKQADDKRIALALAAAYLDESGEFNAMVKKAKTVEKPPALSTQKSLASYFGNHDDEITLKEIKETLALHKMTMKDCDLDGNGSTSDAEIAKVFEGFITKSKQSVHKHR